jgi:aerobic carbon-monoxide dehydrogenase medium subunit
MKPAPFRYHRPASLAEAIAVLRRHGDDAKLLAGGQSLVPLLNMRLVRPEHLVDINRVPELDGIRLAGEELALGATARLAAVERSPLVGGALPLLARGLAQVGHYQIRNRGTVGGSIAHADPAAELPAMLLALDGRVVAESPRGRREIAADQLFQSVFTTALAADEVVVEIRVPRLPAGSRCGLAEFARRHGDFALAGAVYVAPAGVPLSRVVLFGVAGRPLLLPVDGGAEAEDVRRSVIRELGRSEVTSDIHGSAAWRAQVAAEMAVRAWAEAA